MGGVLAARIASRCSNERQYWTIIGRRGLPTYWLAPRNPDSGLPSSSRSIRGIAMNTGNHFRIFQGLLMRMPIRKTTKSPSMSAVTRLSITFAVAICPSA